MKQSKIWLIIVLLVPCGCTGGHQPPPSIRDVWPSGRATTVESSQRGSRTSPESTSPLLAVAETVEVVATVDGEPILRSRMVELLMASRGEEVLDQMIGLAVVQRRATKMGLAISEDDVEAEYERALGRLTDPLAGLLPNAIDLAASEQLLETVLRERKISRSEYLLGIRRNAYLRKMVAAGLMVTEDEIRGEYDVVRGPRAQIRHIQLGSPGDIARVQDRLAAGEDFVELARRYSANAVSARDGGLLPSFSRADETVPKLFRETAFALAAGQVSQPLRVGRWEHLIRLERVIPPEDTPLEEVRGELIERIRERKAEMRMRETYETLYREASIDIQDVFLRHRFEERLDQRLDSSSK